MPRPFSLQQSRLCPVIYGMNSIHILYLYPFVRPTVEYASAVCDLYTTTQTVSLIISKTNRTITRHITTCEQLCHVHSACSSPSSWLSGTPATRRRHFIQITWGGGGDGYLCVAIQSLVSLPPRHFGFRTSGAPSRWGGGLLRTLTIDGELRSRELVNVLSRIHDGRLFIVADTYVGNFQTTILAS